MYSNDNTIKVDPFAIVSQSFAVPTTTISVGTNDLAFEK
jgi:hypothetical protein